MNTCGECAQFKRKAAPGKNEWDGTCKSLGVGRHKTTEACKNPRLQSGAVQ